MGWPGRWGAGLAAFLVTAALSGRAGVTELRRRSVRWRVGVRWYLIALLSVPVGATLISLVIYGPRALATPSGGWAGALADVAAVFLLQLVLFQLAEEAEPTGVPAASLARQVPPVEACAVRGTDVGAMAHARPLRCGGLGSRAAHICTRGFRNRAGLAVLRPGPLCGSTTGPVAACCWWYLHASFDAAINQLYDVVVPGPATASFLIFSGVIVLFAAAVIIATKGQLGGGQRHEPWKATWLASTLLMALQKERIQPIGSAGRLRSVGGAVLNSPACVLVKCTTAWTLPLDVRVPKRGL